jgi:DNA-binding NtrC family response regulator
LLNLVERLMVTSATETIDVADLPRALASLANEQSPPATAGPATLRKALQKVESQMLRDALTRFKTQALAARHLGITQSTVARKAKQYGIDAGGRPPST